MDTVTFDMVVEDLAYCGSRILVRSSRDPVLGVRWVGTSRLASESPVQEAGGMSLDRKHVLLYFDNDWSEWKTGSEGPVGTLETVRGTALEARVVVPDTCVAAISNLLTADLVCNLDQTMKLVCGPFMEIGSNNFFCNISSWELSQTHPERGK